MFMTLQEVLSQPNYSILAPVLPGLQADSNSKETGKSVVEVFEHQAGREGRSDKSWRQIH
jgi:hypothetical protein